MTAPFDHFAAAGDEPVADRDRDGTTDLGDVGNHDTPVDDGDSAFVDTTEESGTVVP